MVIGVIAGLFLLGGLIMYAANQHVDMVTCRCRWIKYGVYILIVTTMIGSALIGYFSWLIGIIIILGMYEMLRLYVCRGVFVKCASALTVSCLIYLVFASGLFLFARSTSPNTIVFVYLTIAVFDGFSQVVGQLAGKHQIAPRISPGKTIEGMVGGLLAAFSVAVILRSLLEISVFQAVILGSLLSLAGLAGDLLASSYKRLHGVKDFGHILPGHGGILDRFDSLFAAGTVFWLYSTFFS